MRFPPPPFCSRNVILLRGNGHRPDKSHFLRPPKLVLEGVLYGTFFPPKIARYVLPSPLRISNFAMNDDQSCFSLRNFGSFAYTFFFGNRWRLQFRCHGALRSESAEEFPSYVLAWERDDVLWHKRDEGVWLWWKILSGFNALMAALLRISEGLRSAVASQKSCNNASVP